jgi:hypothetical protein
VTQSRCTSSSTSQSSGPRRTRPSRARPRRSPCRANAGAPALLESTRLGLSRLLALPEGTLDAVIARFRSSYSERAVGRGAAEFVNGPADIQALAAPLRPLYARGLPVHCLPIYGTWLFARLDAGSDLSEAIPYNQFMRMSRAAFSNTGLSVARHGSHSFSRGWAGPGRCSMARLANRQCPRCFGTGASLPPVRT